MNTAIQVLISTLMAALVPAVLFTALFSIAGHRLDKWSILIFFASWVVSATHITLLGFPAFFFLKKKNLLHFLPIAVAGFVIGVIPSAIFAWPSSPVKGIFLFGALGATSALIFWRTWLLTGEQNK